MRLLGFYSPGIVSSALVGAGCPVYRGWFSVPRCVRVFSEMMASFQLHSIANSKNRFIFYHRMALAKPDEMNVLRFRYEDHDCGRFVGAIETRTVVMGT